MKRWTGLDLCLHCRREATNKQMNKSKDKVVLVSDKYYEDCEREWSDEESLRNCLRLSVRDNLLKEMTRNKKEPTMCKLGKEHNRQREQLSLQGRRCLTRLGTQRTMWLEHREWKGSGSAWGQTSQWGTDEKDLKNFRMFARISDIFKVVCEALSEY